MEDSQERRGLRPVTVGTALSALGIAGLVGAAALRRRFDRRIDARTDALLAAATARRGTFDPADVTDLPDPVERYFNRVLEPGLPYASAVRLRQRGEFRLGDADDSWKPLTARQVYTVTPPGFVWDANIDVLPFLPARVLDYSVDGDGGLDARFLGVLPLSSAGPSPEMNAGELLRYLAEAVWFPSGLLPDAGVEWTGVDDTSARASLEVGRTAVSATFHFDGAGLVDRVTARRYRQETDEMTPWEGRFDNYVWQNRRLVPATAQVAWALPGGDHPYWQGFVGDIDHSASVDRSAAQAVEN